MRKFLMTIAILLMFGIMLNAMYEQGKKIDELKAETLKLQVEIIDLEVVNDELRADAKLNDELASGIYPHLPLPGNTEIASRGGSK